MDLDSITRELAEIIDRLNATPSDDFAARHRLLLRQDELRAYAAAHRVDHDEQRTTEDLQTELAGVPTEGFPYFTHVRAFNQGDSVRIANSSRR